MLSQVSSSGMNSALRPIVVHSVFVLASAVMVRRTVDHLSNSTNSFTLSHEILHGLSNLNH
jgi:hypothetical protein